MDPAQSVISSGTIVAIRGSVIDVHFDGQLPGINHMLRSGLRGEVIIEVADLTGPHSVKGLVFNAQHGLALGMPVTDTGGPITVPVGRSAAGRMLNMFGAPIVGDSFHPQSLNHRGTFRRAALLGVKRNDAPGD